MAFQASMGVRSVRRLRVPAIVLRWGRVVQVLLPTIVAVAYYGLIATDRYVSEARFVIHTAAKPANALGGFSALLQLAGLSRSQDDSYVVHDYLTSRDALHALRGRVDLGRVYGDRSADFVAIYPSLIYDRSEEDLYRYFQNRLTVFVNNTTGLTVLRVEAFQAADAQVVARILLTMGEELVNRLNERTQGDAVRVAATELARAEERRVANEIAVSSFRNRELILDPTASATIVVELIGRLSGQLAEVQARIAETSSNSPNSPQLAPLRQQSIALERQIGVERARVSNGSDGLAEKIARYERLMMDREFSIRALAQAVLALDGARLEARRQQLFLERVVEPGLSDRATEPRRWRTIFTVFGFNVIGLGVIWLVGTGLMEHSRAGR